MKKQLLIYGAGGLGREILSLVKALPTWEVIGFVDDSIQQGVRIHGVEVKGTGSMLQNLTETTSVILAFGDPAVKGKIMENLNQSTFIHFPVLIHPSAILQAPSGIFIGKGSVVCAGCILTTDIQIGEHVLVNLNTTIGHDVSIGNHSSIMVGVNIAGGVVIRDAVLIGSGSNIKNKISIGSKSVVGMGSVVIGNVEESTIVAGVPAKIINR